jgi:anti-sigma factor RsiW
MTSSERTNLEDSVVLLHAYLDGELSVSESAVAERTIAAKPALAAEAAAVRALKHALQTLPRDTMPADVAAWVARQVGVAAAS